MRLSEFANKRIVNIYDGGILGTAGESDLVIDPEDGTIEEMILPPSKGFGAFSGHRRQIIIPWHAIRKVGAEVIVIDFDMV